MSARIFHRFTFRLPRFARATKMILAACILLLTSTHAFPHAAAQTVLCSRPYQPVATPLNDLGAGEYIRMDGQATGFIGGLYPGGSNQPPPAHAAAGLELARSITPLAPDGSPDPDGKIVMISTGMSNAQMEFGRFVQMASQDSRVNPNLVIINGAISNMTADRWSTPDPNLSPWDELNRRLQQAGVTPNQVQVAWTKNTLVQGGDFPAKAEELQGHFETITRLLKSNFPNLKIAYFSSRTRSYLYERGLSPEPVAYETGFAVRWMITKQIDGDPTLNYDPANGEVTAPYLAWGPYLWADGTQPRSDGFTWLPEDLVEDCTHPSDSGMNKVAGLLMDFFTTDPTAAIWFLAGQAPNPTPTPPPPPENPTRTVLPMIMGSPTPAASPVIQQQPAGQTTPVGAVQPAEAALVPTATMSGEDIPSGLTGASRALLIGTAVSGVVVILVVVAAVSLRRR
jgi:hypothetical protein